MSRSRNRPRTVVTACFALAVLFWTAVIAAHAWRQLELSTMPDSPPGVGDSVPAKDNPSGVQGSRLPDAGTQGASVQRLAIITSLYDDALQQINTDLAQAIIRLSVDPSRRGPGFSAARSIELAERINARLARLGVEAKTAVAGAAEASMLAGVREARRQLDALGVARASELTGASFSTAAVNHDAVEAIANDTLARLQAAAGDHAARAQTLFRSLSAGTLSTTGGEAAVNRAIARGIITGNPSTADRAIRNLFRAPGGAPGGLEESYRKLGNKQIVVGGWTGSVRAYAATLVRTRTREATVQARHEAGLRAEIDLVQIVGGTSANFCTRFLGLVCSLTGRTPGYRVYSSLPNGGAPFHPNCSKGTVFYVVDLVSDYRIKAAQEADLAYERAARDGTLTHDLRPSPGRRVA